MNVTIFFSAVIVSLLVTCICAYIGYLIAEARFKHDIEKMKSTIASLNEYIQFLQIELVSERRSQINVTINDSKEEDIYES